MQNIIYRVQLGIDCSVTGLPLNLSAQPPFSMLLNRANQFLYRTSLLRLSRLKVNNTNIKKNAPSPSLTSLIIPRKPFFDCYYLIII